METSHIKEARYLENGYVSSIAVIMNQTAVSEIDSNYCIIKYICSLVLYDL